MRIFISPNCRLVRRKSGPNRCARGPASVALLQSGSPSPATRRNTSPECCRSCPYSALRRHFGMSTTWYLHSIASDLSSHTRPSSLSFACAWRLTPGVSGWTPDRCLASTASPRWAGCTPSCASILVCAASCEQSIQSSFCSPSLRVSLPKCCRNSVRTADSGGGDCFKGLLPCH